MDGGGLVVEDGKVTSAWRRESDIYIAEPGKPERRLGPGKDVAIAKTKRGIFTAWTKDGGVMLKSPGSSQPRVLSANGGFVTLAPLPDGGVLAAWESQGAIDTKAIQ